MKASIFWKAVVADDSDFLARIIDLLSSSGIRYAVIGGQGVNAYVDPVVSPDLDVAVALDQLELAESVLTQKFRVERFEHCLNVSAPGSDLRLQIQTDPRYSEFVPRANSRDVLGWTLQVADVADVLQGKVWAVSDPTRRASTRQKDLADIARLLEAFPEISDRVPTDILARLI